MLFLTSVTLCELGNYLVMQAQVKLPPKRGRAYRCLKGDDFVGERGKVISHIYKMHLPLDQSPYFCTLCTFRCMKLEQLATHVSAYKDHIDRVRRAEESGEEVDEAIHLKESTCPYIVADGLDMERLSADESNSLWQQRAGQRFKNNTVSKAVQPLPAPQPVTAICVPTAAPVTTTTSEPSATEVTVVEAMPDNLSLWSFLNSPAEIQEPPSAIIPPAVEETQKRHSRSQSRSRSRSPESSASSDSCRDQMVKLTQAVVEIVRDNREQMIIFAKAIDDLTAAIRQQNELVKEEREERRERERRETERERREMERQRRETERERRVTEKERENRETGVRELNGRRDWGKENRERDIDDRRHWRHERPQRT
ncbi:glutactin-like [Gigantopelta aegis]|uniref:glutactin-like n=1 Tax=Gigantopelta aegis TaxID=1735272 RepID=UPI001B88887C|nr:glutactin-like [Gigantopelta aegis]